MSMKRSSRSVTYCSDVAAVGAAAKRLLLQPAARGCRRQTAGEYFAGGATPQLGPWHVGLSVVQPSESVANDERGIVRYPKTLKDETRLKATMIDLLCTLKTDQNVPPLDPGFLKDLLLYVAGLVFAKIVGFQNIAKLNWILSKFALSVVWDLVSFPYWL